VLAATLSANEPDAESAADETEAVKPWTALPKTALKETLAPGAEPQAAISLTDALEPLFAVRVDPALVTVNGCDVEALAVAV
jgi:hypothetical protein